jgi:hypothetical protein
MAQLQGSGSGYAHFQRCKEIDFVEDLRLRRREIGRQGWTKVFAERRRLPPRDAWASSPTISRRWSAVVGGKLLTRTGPIGRARRGSDHRPIAGRFSAGVTDCNPDPPAPAINRTSAADEPQAPIVERGHTNYEVTLSADSQIAALLCHLLEMRRDGRYLGVGWETMHALSRSRE